MNTTDNPSTVPHAAASPWISPLLAVGTMAASIIGGALLAVHLTGSVTYAYVDMPTLDVVLTVPRDIDVRSPGGVSAGANSQPFVVPFDQIPAFEATVSQLRGEPWRMPFDQALLEQQPALAALARRPVE
jgi:hypothetical protein